jgi:hypothetical protein
MPPLQGENCSGRGRDNGSAHTTFSCDQYIPAQTKATICREVSQRATSLWALLLVGCGHSHFRDGSLCQHRLCASWTAIESAAAQQKGIKHPLQSHCVRLTQPAAVTAIRSLLSAAASATSTTQLQTGKRVGQRHSSSGGAGAQSRAKARARPTAPMRCTECMSLLPAMVPALNHLHLRCCCCCCWGHRQTTGSRCRCHC